MGSRVHCLGFRVLGFGFHPASVMVSLLCSRGKREKETSFFPFALHITVSIRIPGNMPGAYVHYASVLNFPEIYPTHNAQFQALPEGTRRA